MPDKPLIKRIYRPTQPKSIGRRKVVGVIENSDVHIIVTPKGAKYCVAFPIELDTMEHDIHHVSKMGQLVVWVVCPNEKTYWSNLAKYPQHVLELAD